MKASRLKTRLNPLNNLSQVEPMQQAYTADGTLITDKRPTRSHSTSGVPFLIVADAFAWFFGERRRRHNKV